MTALTRLFRCLCLGSTLFSVPVSAATLFYEDFNSDTMGGTWRGYNTFSVAGTPYGSMGLISGATNSPTGQSDPYMFAQNNTPSGATSPADYFFYTSTATVGASAFAGLVPADYSVFSATWNQNTGGSMTGMSAYLTVLVDNQWYATSVGSAVATNLYSVDFLAASWFPVSFTAGTSMSLSTTGTPTASSALFTPGQTIDGLGFYVKNLPGASPSPATDYRTIRFDNLTVAAAPEPGRFMLLGLAAGGLLLRRRRTGSTAV